MGDDIVGQLGSAVIIPHIIEWLKRSKYFPLISQMTPNTNRVLGIICAWGMGCGIEIGHEGWTLEGGGRIVIDLPMLSVMATAITRSAIQWAMQEGYYHNLMPRPRNTAQKDPA